MRTGKDMCWLDPRIVSAELSDMKKATLVFEILLVVAILMLSCQKNEEMISATIVPLDKNAELRFRGYVTDEDSVLVSKIYDFGRRFSHRDTIGGKEVFVILSNNEKIPFYVDGGGRLVQMTTVNLLDRVFPFKIKLLGMQQISYWETLYDEDDGVGTEWQVEVDTTVSGIDSTGRSIAIRYFYSGRARNEGWKDIFIPRTYKPEKLVDVHWYEMQNEIINLTANDTLFYRVGTAHHYFDPKLGILKYITDYEIREGAKAPAKLHGTWELIEVKNTRETNEIE